MHTEIVSDIRKMEQKIEKGIGKEQKRSADKDK